MNKSEPAFTSGDPTAPSASGRLHLSPTRGTSAGGTSLAAYCAPAISMGFTQILIGIYLLKYSTDVLGIAPATIGLWFGISRIWDAVSDPIVGYWTDRTQSRWGRRRPWMLAGVIPMALAFWAVWGLPAGLTSEAAALWIGIAIVAYYSAYTTVDVPHAALGAELSDDYHARTRIFGVRRLMFGVGSLGAVAAIAAFGQSSDPRGVGNIVGVIGASLAIVTVVVGVVGSRERPEYRDRGARNVYAALSDIWRNLHARRLLAVFLVQQLAVNTLMVSIPFLSQYVLGTPEYTFWYIGVLMFTSILGVPLCLRFAPRLDKKTAVIGGMSVIAVAVAVLPFLPPGQPYLVMLIAGIAGFASGWLDVVFPSLKADVIDVDELATGERKEGAYFATWAFAAKTSAGFATMIVGFALQSLDFAPNGEQTEFAKAGLRALGGGLPALFYAAGIAIFLRFSLTASAHREVRRALRARALAATG